MMFSPLNIMPLWPLWPLLPLLLVFVVAFCMGLYVWNASEQDIAAAEHG
jgi:hypothetical protein